MMSGAAAGGRRVHPETAAFLANALRGALGREDPGEIRVSGEESRRLTPEGFSPIRVDRSAGRCGFVDGGTQELVGAPGLSVQLHRVYAGCWRGRERCEPASRLAEFFSIAEAGIDGSLRYTTRIVPAVPGGQDALPDESDLSFSAMDPTLQEGGKRAPIVKSGDVVRRFAEWRAAAELVRALSPGDAIVMDGSLQTAYTNEGRYCQAVGRAASAQGVVLCGLAKSSSLVTSTGLPLVTAVDLMAGEHGVPLPWCYHVGERREKGEFATLYVVKLHRAADRAYRFEVRFDAGKPPAETEVEAVLASLAANAGDAGFPGYPYGLVDADRRARVRIDEQAYYRGCLLAGIGDGRHRERLLACVRAGDAHGVLDRMIG
jgi:hypothetical protein